ncbi:uncharacterized protein LOC112535176 isoform X2 [Ricinus communis]|uniref:uncharacterized protein LOC112535176 isoform X2 n=1 Tax=Ricinus communis TaxID=3988 RepID=UPI00201B324C|nr:uncharacterized protein LOC112535176 isoform X2 [Ricinus communis]
MELDYRSPNDMTCAADIEKQRKRIAEDRIYMFLAGLDHSLDQVSSRVLATSPLPSLEKTYFLVRREVQRQVTMGTENHFEASALMIQKSTSQVTPSVPVNSTASNSHFCTHCNSTRHTVDVCWKKHGYSEWYKLKQAEKKNKKYTQIVVPDTSPPSASHVFQVSPQQGNSSLTYVSTASNTWVIDSGATDHMTRQMYEDDDWHW